MKTTSWRASKVQT